MKVKTSDVFFVEALKDYVVINTGATRYTIHSTMKDIEKKLPATDFIRVHRSFIVRITTYTRSEPLAARLTSSTFASFIFCVERSTKLAINARRAGQRASWHFLAPI